MWPRHDANLWSGGFNATRFNIEYLRHVAIVTSKLGRHTGLFWVILPGYQVLFGRCFSVLCWQSINGHAPVAVGLSWHGVLLTGW